MLSAYCASKWAIRGLSLTAAAEFAPFGAFIWSTLLPPSCNETFDLVRRRRRHPLKLHPARRDRDRHVCAIPTRPAVGRHGRVCVPFFEAPSLG